MVSTRIDREIVFVVECPAIRRKVILYKQTWEEHILPARPGLKQRLGLIRELIEKSPPDMAVYQSIDNPEKLLNDSKTAIVTTVVPVNNLPTIGVKKYERK